MIRHTNRDLWLWGLAVAAVIFNSAVASRNLDRMVATEKTLQETRAAQIDWIALLALANDAETGHRGYIITGKASYLEPLEIARLKVQPHIDQMRARFVDNPEQNRRLDQVEVLVQEKFKEMQRTIAIRRDQDRDIAAAAMSNDLGKVVMDQIRQLIAAALIQEEQVLNKRDLEASERLHLARYTNTAAAGLAIGIVLAAAATVRTELNRRRRTNEALTVTQTQLQASFETIGESVERYRILSESLEQMVKQKTAALLEQSQQLQTSNEELEKFAYIASHDLQEPLRKIQSFGDRLLKKQRDSLDAEGQDAVDRMLSAASRMRRLIEDLLAFSRVSTTGKPFEPVNLNETLEEIRSVFELRLQQTGCVLTVDPLPTLAGDESQLSQLFQNLVGNALKFAKPDVPSEILVTAIPFEKLGIKSTGWRIEVRDNGIGFEDQYADRIFELFQRLHGRNQYEGTGLGLAICKKIVERHGATIAARGELGRGATFVLDWPVSSPGT